MLSVDLISRKAFGHTGFTGTSLWIDPNLQAFFVLLTNRVHPTRGNDAIIRFRPRFHNSAIAELGKL
ncbi:MAG: beta-lactamase family protein [Firmicutes bacterium]|nr:beta-lactamase family protein [Bacillota bacterium]